ncbi:L,D-transpeptidase family protein [Clostridium estertheticum]|uniref:L,D-transpeptidase family protein n=1 Tax=Clostridium estertheticum TaxID=238834 RepID=UPI0013E985D5|nr:L,D-transpeptidase family protein [Clostridium estertheticum]MBZ9685352.1 L,D-transpeptidase family protein [Clostridium estertheticum]
MSKKNIVIGALLTVGAVGAYELYKKNSIINDSSFYKVDEADRQFTWSLEEEDFFFKKPEEKPQDVAIKVYKSIRILELYGDDNLIGKFKIALGGDPIGDKIVEGDRKTPEGKYHICTRNDKSKYTLFLGLNYPNVEDAQRGLENGLIDELEFKEVEIKIQTGKRPNFSTPLGGAIGIHGGGTLGDWTAGCIALSDDDIRIIWEYTKINTSVEIYE